MQKNKFVHEDIKAVCNSAAKNLVALGLAVGIGGASAVFSNYKFVATAQYVEEEDGAHIVSCNHLRQDVIGELVIPEQINGIQVVVIENDVFYNCGRLTSVTIPHGVKTIGKLAFQYCAGLKHVTLPDTVIQIGRSAFEGCTALSAITYAGTQSQWKAVQIGSANDPVLNAKVNFGRHIWNDGETIAQSTCTEEGEVRYVCTDCGVVRTESLPTKGHSYENGICTGCGEVKEALKGSIRLRSGTLNLLDKICIIYKASDDLVPTNEVDVAERGVLLYDSAEKAASKDPALAYETVKLEYDPAEGRFVGQTEGIDARDMGKSQFAVAYVRMADGTVYYGTKDGTAQAPIEYSPLIYCRNKKTDPEISTLCRAMMQYGAAAQVAQYANPGPLMNEGFAAVAYDESVLGETVLVTNTAVINGMRLRSATMDLKGAISYIVKYSVEDAGLGDKQLYAEYTIHTERKVLSGEVALEPGTDGRLWATISGVPPKDIGAKLTVRPYYLDESGNKVYGGELVYSGYEYVRRAQTNTGYDAATKELAKALAMYVHYANIYGYSK